MTPRITVLLVLGLALCGSLFAAQPARSLRDTLTPDAFKRSGLEKLTDEELAYLSIQLFGEAAPKKHTTKKAQRPDQDSASDKEGVADAAAEAVPAQGIIASLPHGEAAFGNEEKLAVAVTKIQKVPQEMTSRIKGSFAGWSGKTVFVLENGQKWKQAEPAEFDVNLESPEITIKKGLFGVFYLRVTGYGSSVKVKRVE